MRKTGLLIRLLWKRQAIFLGGIRAPSGVIEMLASHLLPDPPRTPINRAFNEFAIGTILILDDVRPLLTADEMSALRCDNRLVIIVQDRSSSQAEHVVDTVLVLRQKGRTLTCTKNRFGPTGSAELPETA